MARSLKKGYFIDDHLAKKVRGDEHASATSR